MHLSTLMPRIRSLSPLLLIAAVAAAAFWPARQPAQALATTPTLTPTTPASGFQAVYIVKDGDQLLKIARQFGVTLTALKTYNGLVSDLIFPGQRLLIPIPTPRTPTATVPAGANIYIVRPGDQLIPIARLFGITVSQLRTANGLTTSSVIVPGQRLVIPTPLPPTVTPVGQQIYIVQPGDQLIAVARRFGLTPASLKLANGLTSDTLYTGQRLIIPAPTPVRTPTALPPGAQLYTVLPGDQLTFLGRKFGVSVAAIKAANRLTRDTIYPGQVLVIPARTTPLPPIQATYVVQRGDSLTSIAERFGVSVQAIMDLNLLFTEVIQPGQQLLIPAP